MQIERDWPSEWLRGVLEVLVLQCLADGPTWGYAIAESLQGAGFGTVKGGTLYPLLGRLEESGFVSVEWRAGDGGPGRKYFTLTDAGARSLSARATQWQAFSRLAQGYLGASTPSATSTISTYPGIEDLT